MKNNHCICNQGLNIDDLEDLIEDIKVYKQLEQGRNAEFWKVKIIYICINIHLYLYMMFYCVYISFYIYCVFDQ